MLGESSFYFYSRQSCRIVLDEELLGGWQNASREDAIDGMHVRDALEIFFGEGTGELKRGLNLRHRDSE